MIALKRIVSSPWLTATDTRLFDRTLVRWPRGQSLRDNRGSDERGELGMRRGICVAALLLAPVAGVAQPAGAREAFLKVCGGCHPVETVTWQRRSRAQWQESINSMVTRGAKGTDDGTRGHPGISGHAVRPGIAGAVRTAGGGGGATPRTFPGSADKHVVDEAAANRGRKVYAAECINCHGTQARGTDNGADLMRSEVVLHDRYGSTSGRSSRRGIPPRPRRSRNSSAAQIEDLSHTIHQQVYNTLRAALEIQNVLTGDAKAGAAYFNGEGKCSTCHSPTGDLARSARGWIRRRCSSASCSPAAAVDAAGEALRRRSR